MVIVLTMDEVKDIVAGVFVDITSKDCFMKIQGTQNRHITKEWRDYLTKINMTAEEFNLWMDDLNTEYIQEAIKMAERLKTYDDSKKVFKYVNRLSKKFGDVVFRFREEGYIDVMKEKKSMRSQIASRFSIMLTIENNSRNMGYNNYQDLCDFRNSYR